MSVSPGILTELNLALLLQVVKLILAESFVKVTVCAAISGCYRNPVIRFEYNLRRIFFLLCESELWVDFSTRESEWPEWERERIFKDFKMVLKKVFHLVSHSRNVFTVSHLFSQPRKSNVKEIRNLEKIILVKLHQLSSQSQEWISI